MRTTLALTIFGSIGLAAMIVTMSGLPGILGVGSTDNIAVDDKVGDLSQEEELGVQGGQDPDGLQFLVSGLGTAYNWLAGVFLLPITFNRWMPWYGAYPIGLGLQGLAIWGLVQMAGGSLR